ncbi:hypothetical protein LNTAR_17703 [Lentisphaera araneosa HTCC2155]|uniref:Uncharacterized protein n=1 Tax=Lentisphaera araneosa HTCC2155 TaxID=313628 RepID=A6DFM9_9BACT|nr:hypothetical protein LNTAR_17703 [Lentisphaera araneosa HTCC2155]
MRGSQLLTDDCPLLILLSLSVQRSFSEPANDLAVSNANDLAVSNANDLAVSNANDLAVSNANDLAVEQSYSAAVFPVRNCRAGAQRSQVLGDRCRIECGAPSF